jgi:hypothetical protein
MRRPELEIQQVEDGVSDVFSTRVTTRPHVVIDDGRHGEARARSAGRPGVLRMPVATRDGDAIFVGAGMQAYRYRTV